MGWLRRCKILCLGLFFVGCADIDNSPEPTPLTDFVATVDLKSNWQARRSNSGFERFVLAVDRNIVYMASAEQGIASFSLADGQTLSTWPTPTPLTAGVAAQQHTIIAVGHNGEVYAFASDGKVRWKTKLVAEIIAPPVIDSATVVLRSVDGRLWALGLADGAVRWQYQSTQSALIMRNYAAVTVIQGIVFAGLANGRVIALHLADGKVLWDTVIAQPKGATELERLVDITSLPVADNEGMCAVAFQGQLSCFTPQGHVLWSRDISSYVGLSVADKDLYITDNNGIIHALARDSGALGWQQRMLYARGVTAPVVWGNYLVVGDYQGFIHVLDRHDGRFVARAATDGSRILVPPTLVYNRLLVQTEAGSLYSFVKN